MTKLAEGLNVPADGEGKQTENTTTENWNLRHKALITFQPSDYN